MTRSAQRSARVLLVEDNPGDVELVQRALASSSRPPVVTVATDGDAAIAALGRAPLPDLVILDLNLPGTDGRDVLRWIKSAVGLAWMPVCIFSSSASERDVRSCYERHANCYVRKPGTLEGFATAISRIEQFWLDTAELPLTGGSR